MPTTDDHSTATTTSINCRRIENTSNNDWITSGELGSRDAVLVFRTATLDSCVKPLLSLSDSDISKTDVTTLCGSYTPNYIAFPRSTNMHKCHTVLISQDNQDISKEKNVLSNLNKYQEQIFVRKSKCLTSADIEKLLSNSVSSSNSSLLSECERSNEKGDVNNKFSPINNNGRNKTHVGGAEDSKCSNTLSPASNHYMPMRGMPAIDLKITYKFMQTETKLLRQIFERHGLTEAEDDDNFSILWTGVHMKPDILRNLTPYQRVNHFPRSYELTRKDRLYKNIERMQHLRGFKHFDIVPQSFLLPLEYKDLVSAHNKCRGPWIVKPAASSRGRGIFIVNSPEQIPQDEQVLVSKYVVDPLCIDGHKCDLRVYVLVTSFDPLLIYIYEEGLVRLATVKYDRNVDNLWNPCMHLCNYSINKYHTDYIKSSDAYDEDVGHKWTLSALLRHLKSRGCDTHVLMSNIEDLIIKSILACAQSIISACRMFVPNCNNCFELYGFDILIDAALKPWLLEINLSPSMGVDSPLDARVKACLITDLLTCVGIPAFSPAMRTHYDNKWTRFRRMNYRRCINSVEPTSGNGSVVRRFRSLGTAAKQLTLEEQRIIRNASLQNARRGGFVRIFPVEDTMTRYGNFLDPTTGIPLSTTITLTHNTFNFTLLQHNYNQMLFNSLYKNHSHYNVIKEENSYDERMKQYERALETASLISFAETRNEPKSEEEGKRLRKQILKFIDSGSELTQLQARQAFASYLDTILHRLTQEPRDSHEKIILKFLNRVGGTSKPPVFLRNSQNIRVVGKARSAMVAKLLSDFLQQYNKDTESYVDAFDHFGMIPSGIFAAFLSQAQETDLEAVLALHTNLTGTMPYLYNRCGLTIPPTPLIPSGSHGFLKALPTMVLSGSIAREFNKYDVYSKSMEKNNTTAKHHKISKNGACRKNSAKS